jgi:hypothetical protein
LRYLEESIIKQELSIQQNVKESEEKKKINVPKETLLVNITQFQKKMYYKVALPPFSIFHSPQKITKRLKRSNLNISLSDKEKKKFQSRSHTKGLLKSLNRNKALKKGRWLLKGQDRRTPL